jgi:hypothetical protein
MIVASYAVGLLTTLLRAVCVFREAADFREKKAAILVRVALLASVLRLRLCFLVVYFTCVSMFTCPSLVVIVLFACFVLPARRACFERLVGQR